MLYRVIQFITEEARGKGAKVTLCHTGSCLHLGPLGMSLLVYHDVIVFQDISYRQEGCRESDNNCTRLWSLLLIHLLHVSCSMVSS